MSEPWSSPAAAIVWLVECGAEDGGVSQTGCGAAAASFGVPLETTKRGAPTLAASFGPMEISAASLVRLHFDPAADGSVRNPGLAYEALQLEDKVGTMLPCNVIVQEIGPAHTEVAAIDPVASMQAIDNSELLRKAEAVRAKLEAAVQSL